MVPCPQAEGVSMGTEYPPSLTHIELIGRQLVGVIEVS